MSTHNDPWQVGTFVTLRHDRMIHAEQPRGNAPRHLTLLLPGPTPYQTIPLADGLEMHHAPASHEDPNELATLLGERFGYRVPIHGLAHFTGPSAETDHAPAMGVEPFLALMEALDDISIAHGAPMWTQYEPDETVLVRPSDYAPGDTYWAFGQPHQFRGLTDIPATSKTAQMFPGVQYIQCTDGWTMTASGCEYPTRAEHAPPRLLAAHWQPTPAGSQLTTAHTARPGSSPGGPRRRAKHGSAPNLRPTPAHDQPPATNTGHRPRLKGHKMHSTHPTTDAPTTITAANLEVGDELSSLRGLATTVQEVTHDNNTGTTLLLLNLGGGPAAIRIPSTAEVTANRAQPEAGQEADDEADDEAVLTTVVLTVTEEVQYEFTAEVELPASVAADAGRLHHYLDDNEDLWLDYLDPIGSCTNVNDRSLDSAHLDLAAQPTH